LIVVGVVERWFDNDFDSCYDYFEKSNHNNHISCWSGELVEFDCDQEYMFYIASFFAVVVAFPVGVAKNSFVSVETDHFDALAIDDFVAVTTAGNIGSLVGAVVADVVAVGALVGNVGSLVGAVVAVGVLVGDVVAAVALVVAVVALVLATVGAVVALVFYMPLLVDYFLCQLLQQMLSLEILLFSL
jgi:hypothetical protein